MDVTQYISKTKPSRHYTVRAIFSELTPDQVRKMNDLEWGKALQPLPTYSRSSFQRAKSNSIAFLQWWHAYHGEDFSDVIKTIQGVVYSDVKTETILPYNMWGSIREIRDFLHDAEEMLECKGLFQLEEVVCILVWYGVPRLDIHNILKSQVVPLKGGTGKIVQPTREFLITDPQDFLAVSTWANADQYIRRTRGHVGPSPFLPSDYLIRSARADHFDRFTILTRINNLNKDCGAFAKKTIELSFVKKSGRFVRLFDYLTANNLPLTYKPELCRVYYKYLRDNDQPTSRFSYHDLVIAVEEFTAWCWEYRYIRE